MKDLILIGFFCASLFCYPQSEEDQVIDSILDELFETEASPVDFSQSHFLYTSLSFDESVFFAGRNFGIDQFGFTPSISYMKGKNFYIGSNGKLIEAQDMVKNLPYIFGEMKNNNGIEKISDFLTSHGGL